MVEVGKDEKGKPIPGEDRIYQRSKQQKVAGAAHYRCHLGGRQFSLALQAPLGHQEFFQDDKVVPELSRKSSKAEHMILWLLIRLSSSAVTSCWRWPGG